MQQIHSQNWQMKLKTALLADPKKTAVLGVLAAVMIAMVGRLLLQGGRLTPVVAAVVPVNAGTTSVSIAPTVERPKSSSASMHDWLNAPLPVVSRNMFLLKPEYYGQEDVRAVQEIPDGGFWLDLEKSLSLQADQRDKRTSLVASVKAAAESIRPQSTIMGSGPDQAPRAMINGTLIAEGEEVNSFRVLRIEPRGIIVEREGVKLAIPMRQ